MTKEQVPDCLYYLVTRATAAATSLLKKSLAEAGVGEVRPAFLGLLISLWTEDGLKSSRLGKLAGIEPSTMTGLLDRLEGAGLIQRQADPEDRRAQRIRLTEQGRALESPVKAVVDKVLARATEGLAESEIDTAKSVLKRFLHNAQA